MAGITLGQFSAAGFDIFAFTPHTHTHTRTHTHTHTHTHKQSWSRFASLGIQKGDRKFFFF